MDVYISMTSTQLLLLWILLAFLVAWMVTFFLLALRPDTKKSLDEETSPTPVRPFLVTVAAPKLQVIASPPTNGPTLTTNRDTADEANTAQAVH